MDQGYSYDEAEAPFPSFDEDYDKAVAGYVPFWDELAENWEDLGDESSPFDPSGNELFAIRQFHVYQPLDEHRFVYWVSSWEWCNGYGVYDLQTRTDHRITGRGDFFGVAGDTLLGTHLKADANTYKSSPLPEPVQEQLDASSWGGDASIDCAISPNGTLLALTGWEYTDSGAGIVTVTDIETGEILKSYDLYNPFATEYSIQFYDDTHFMLFCRPEELGSPYMYLFDLEK